MRIAVFAPLLALAACATPHNVEMTATYDNRPTIAFAYCISMGCTHVMTAKFSEAEWAEIGAFFNGTTDAADERARIAKAVTRFEQLAGVKGGTSGDTGGTGLNPVAVVGQLDCFAEAANTTVALQMMQKSGFLKFHVVDRATMRGVPYGTLGLVHATATIKEIADGHLWVVDTWFFDNGGPTFVIDRDEWRSHWAPKGGAGI